MEKNKEKEGLAIGFIADKTVPTKWMMRLNDLAQGIPSGVFWSYIWYEGSNYKEKGGYANARNKVVEQAKAMNVKWILWLDTDVMIEPNMISQLMADNKDIVCGIYYMKTMPPQPVIFKKLGDGPYYDFPIEELFEIEGSGMGFCLVKTEIYDAFDKAKIPYFKENWEYTREDGRKIKVKIGEDHWFFHSCKQLGYKIYADSRCLADHIDSNGTAFPGEEEVQRIRKLALEKYGRKDIIKANEELYGVDSNKKTIVFYAPYATEFSGDELEIRGVGGTETALIHIAKNLAKLYNVIVFNNNPRPGIYDGVKYLHLQDTEFMKKFKTDLFVCLRNAKILQNEFRKEFKIDKIALWMHDIPESPAFDGICEADYDYLICVSEWHKNAVKAKYPNIPKDKFIVLKNGIDKALFDDIKIDRVHGKMIYSSTPFRGLNVLLDVFPEIKKRVPEANLHIFSSMKIYGKGYNDEYQDLYKKASNMDGVFYNESIIQKELAKEIKSSMILAYPNHYPESYGITIDENIYAGTPIVSTNLAAIPETRLPGCGNLISGDSNSKEYQEKFIEAVSDLLTSKDKWDTINKNCISQKDKIKDWKDRACQWIMAFFPEDTDKVDKIYAKVNINTPEYWNKQYKYEIENKIDQRSDPDRWDILINKIPHNANVLDFGCGEGNFLRYLKDKRSDCNLNGIDFSDYAIQYARGLEQGAEKPIKYNVKLSETTLNEGRKFEYISIQHALEHIDNPKEFMLQMLHLLTHDGILALAIPLNDKWIEHVNIFNIYDIHELIRSLSENIEVMYSVHIRKETIRKKNDGSFVEEAIIFIKKSE